MHLAVSLGNEVVALLALWLGELLPDGGRGKGNAS